jgi:predicted Rossmann-fold nucleotide-binding protein
MSMLEDVTQALVDLGAAEHLDEDWALPCETSHAETQQGEWIVTWSCACPPPSVVLCTGCKDGVMAAPNIVCDDCHVMFVPGSTSVRLIEPLNRRTT